jgi:hypothetical protein
VSYWIDRAIIRLLHRFAPQLVWRWCAWRMARSLQAQSKALAALTAATREATVAIEEMLR